MNIPRPPESAQHARPLRVLIVDDSPDDAELIMAALRRASVSCDCTQVEDEDGLESALAALPDAVICDNFMPLLTVARVAETVAARDAECPLIVVSGLLAEVEGTTLINGVCRDFVRKDALHRLPAALRREIEAAAARRRIRAAVPALADARASRIEHALRGALERGELALHYQPQLDMRTGRITAAEALARWNDPELGEVPPAEFVAIAEASDIGLALGRWTIAEAARQLRRWAAEGRSDLILSVNLSARHFASGSDLAVYLAEAISGHGLNPRNLRIEITESTLIEHVQSASEVMRRIAALGVEFAVDDFGTSYSSLSYLRRFPISEVKIDRSFIADMTTSAESMVIARGIVAMAHALGARVVAEGVETEAQFGALQRMHCDLVQGYLVGRPVAAAELDAMLDGPPFLGCAPDAHRERTLLIVDDEPNIAASLNRLLRRDGYRTLTATSAAEGLQLLGTNDVGVIISDQRMPVMSGTEFLHRVKDMYPGTVRMVLSGFTDLASITSAINEGAIYKFLTKPWEDEIMRATVREAFERHELMRENERLGEEARAASLRLAEANSELERRVAENASDLSRQLAVLKVFQETLDCMPLGVVGVDAEGMVAAANDYAVTALGAAPGSAASDCLPAPLVEILGEAQARGGEARGRFEHHAVLCSPMGLASAGRGSVLVAIPASV